MKLKILYILTIFFSTSCSIHGTYEDKRNDGYAASWIKIKPDGTFEYINWGHMAGYGYTKGSWTANQNIIYLNELEPKLPTTNELIEIHDGKRTINIKNVNGED